MSVGSRSADCLRRGLSSWGVESAGQLPLGANTPLRYSKVHETTAEPE